MPTSPIPAPTGLSSGCLLFAYGTLMTGVTAGMGKPQRARLVREARSLGSATTEGRLYDLGRYPGLVLDASSASRVHGEVLALTDPATTLAWLDAYEGIEPGRSDPCEYARVERPVELAEGRRLMAFVYVYQHDISHARLMPDGRWLSRPV